MLRNVITSKVKAHAMVHPGSSVLSESDPPCSSQVVLVRGMQCERLLVQRNGALSPLDRSAV